MSSYPSRAFLSELTNTVTLPSGGRGHDQNDTRQVHGTLRNESSLTCVVPTRDTQGLQLGTGV